MLRRTKLRRSIQIGDSAPPEAGEYFAHSNCATYLLRLLNKYPTLDYEVLHITAWALEADIQCVLDYLLEQMTEREKARYKDAGEESCEDADDILHLIIKILRQNRKSIKEKFYKYICGLLKNRIDELKHSAKSEDEKKLTSLKKLFNLTEQECEFCRFLYIVSNWRIAEPYFYDHLKCNTVSGRNYLSVVLGMTERDLVKVFEGTLARIEFYEMDNYSIDIKDVFHDYFRQSSSKWLAGHLFRPVSHKTIPLECHIVESLKTDHILSLLKSKRSEPVHILLYGPAGTGKTSYAMGMAKKLGNNGYEILREKENKSANRRAAIIACLQMNSASNGCVIMVDEADNLLNTRNAWFLHGETQDKGWLNQLLEEPKARMIWIVNETEMIEESVLRRFAFSLPFRPFNRSQKIQICESVLRQNKVIQHFNPEDISALVKKYPVSGGVIDTAVKKARLACPPSDKRFKDKVVMALEAFQELLNGGRKLRNSNGIEKAYSLEGLNIEGNINVLMDQLAAFSSYLNERQDNENRNFNLLFYGPPGTGKSELARYIAENLGRQMIVKRLSDILNPYVGQTEKNIAEMFSEAENSAAVMVIDEADAVLFSRERAKNSWEISFTNEFLTQMERYRGIMICTTNRLTDLDYASIRRFNHKVGFRYLEPAGNVIFYRKMLSPLTSEPLNESSEAQLKQLADIAPGDFKIVRDRFSICATGQITHQLLIDALREESLIKKVQQGRKHIGFCSK